MKCTRLVGFAALAGACGWLASAGAQAPAPKELPKPPPPPPPTSPGSMEIESILGKTLEEWLKECRHGDPSVRENAFRTIPIFGERARTPAAPYLVAALDDPDASCRAAGAVALATLGLEGEVDRRVRTAVSVLTKHLDDPQGIVRYHCAVALARVAAGAPQDAKVHAIRKLSADTMFDKSTWEIRKAAAFTLGRIAGGDPAQQTGPDSRAIIALSNGLKDPSSQVRQEVIRSLIVLGSPSSPEDLAALKESLALHAIKDRDKGVAIWSRVCLMRLDIGQARGPAFDENLGALKEFLRDDDLAAAMQAAYAIGTIGYDARGAVPDLAKLLDHKEQAVVAAGMWAIGRMKTSGAPAMAKLQALTKHESEYIQKMAKATIDLVEGKEPKPPAGAGNAAAVPGAR